MAASRESHGESLRELAARVHERLHHAASVDPDTRRLLVTLMQDIERTLNGPRAHHESVSTLEALAARFDAEHPALAQTLRQLIDFLGKAGI